MGNFCSNVPAEENNQYEMAGNYAQIDDKTMNKRKNRNKSSKDKHSNFNNSKNKDRYKINESKSSKDERDYERARSRQEDIINSDERTPQKSKNVGNNQSSSKTKTKNSEEDIGKNKNQKQINVNREEKSARSPPEDRKKTKNSDNSNKSYDESSQINNNFKSEEESVTVKDSKKKGEFANKTDNHDSIDNDVRNRKPNPQKSNEIQTKHEPSKKKYSAIKYPGLRKEMYDTILYRAEYMGDEDDPKLNKNLMFYKNEIESEPDGDTIKTILLKWKGNYNKLEKYHGYIQWLFPIREQGLNEHAHPLQLHELKELKESRTVVKRLIESYKLMLDFYGMEIENEETGELKRSENYKERYRNLIKHTHNNLRITRILKCLGEFDLNSYQMKLLEFIILEVFQSGELESLDDSLTRYWIHTVKDDNERERLIRQVEDMVDKNY